MENMDGRGGKAVGGGGEKGKNEVPLIKIFFSCSYSYTYDCH